MRSIIANWWGIALAVAGAGAAAALLYAAFRRNPKTPEEIERERRLYLKQVGRIVEGHIVEIVEQPREPVAERRRLFGRRSAARPPGTNGTHKLLFYSYSISGVTYETAQDITGLEERACLNRVVAGQPASVKYDPSNPSNSILVADDWSGLH